MVAPYPHCNSDVLHAPGDCVYCDKYPEKQKVRAAGRTPFTPLESNGWSGNVAVKAGELHSHMGATYLVEDGDPDAPCDLPSFGFFCLGGKGHGGPCAAWCHWWYKPVMYAKTGVWWP